jgi:hypothetical protein
MKLTLTACAALLKNSGDAPTAKTLTTLSTLFEGAAAITVTKLVANIQTNWNLIGRKGTFPYELKIALEKVATVFDAAGARSQKKDFTTLLNLFTGIGDQPIDIFISEARAASSTPKKPSPRKPPANRPQKKPQSTNEDNLRSTAFQLTNLKPDRVRFDALLAQCESELSAPGLKALAALFLGHPLSSRKKADITNAMKKRQRQDELNSDREAAQLKIRP